MSGTTFPSVNGYLLSSEHVYLRTDDGEPIATTLYSMKYNATISAFELRAYRSEAGPALPDLSKRGPLHVFAMGARVYEIHYEAVTVVPFEFDCDVCVVTKDKNGDTVSRDVPVTELVVLRGARIVRV